MSSDKEPVRGPRLGWAASPACAGDDEQPGRRFREPSSKLSAGTGGINETSVCKGSLC